MTSPSAAPHQDPGDRPLERAVAALPADRPSAPLGLVAVPLVLGVVVGSQAVQLLLPLPGLLRFVGGVAVLVGATYALCHRAARQAGGWTAAVGLDRPVPRDAGLVVVWLLLSLAAQTAAIGAVTAVTPWKDAAPDNVGDLGSAPWWAVVLTALLAVVMAPVVEELLFRGLLLRGLMTRTGFWPATLVSSVLFGLVHVPGALSGALSIVVANTVLGVLLCLLVRRTGRLAPAIALHAARNALGIAAVLLVV